MLAQGEIIPATGESEEPITPDDLTDDSGNSKGGFDFISKLLSWLADLFRMFTRWITNV